MGSKIFIMEVRRVVVRGLREREGDTGKGRGRKRREYGERHRSLWEI